MPGTTVPARGPLYVRVNEVGQLESSYHIGQEEGRKNKAHHPPDHVQHLQSPEMQPRLRVRVLGWKAGDVAVLFGEQ